MFETWKPHILDFGRWTQWARPDDSPRPIDGVICGITSGNYPVQTYYANREAVKLEKRKFVYHFFEKGFPAQVQADVFSAHGEFIEPLVYAIDWEEYTKSSTGERVTYGAAEAYELVKIYEILTSRFPRALVYSNIDDFEILVKYVPEFARDCNLWIAYPPGPNSPNFEKTDWEDWPMYNEERLGRPWSSVKFLQYIWCLDGPTYGTLNNKLEIDGNVFQGTMKELDAWLDINQGCRSLITKAIKSW